MADDVLQALKDNIVQSDMDRAIAAFKRKGIIPT